MDYIYAFFLNLTRFFVSGVTILAWAYICTEKKEIVDIPWPVVFTIAALYGDKGLNAAKSAISAVGGKK